MKNLVLNLYTFSNSVKPWWAKLLQLEEIPIALHITITPTYKKLLSNPR